MISKKKAEVRAKLETLHDPRAPERLPYQRAESANAAVEAVLNPPPPEPEPIPEPPKTITLTYEQWYERRQLYRSDLRALCRLLGYMDVEADNSEGPHWGIVSYCQRLPGGTEVIPKDRKITLKVLRENYKPLVPMWDILGKRNGLFLVSRGTLKSTIITQAHTIQWILNYPDVRIKIISAKLTRAEDFLRAIREHFIRNENFRAFFPEFCPQVLGKSGKISDFGNQEQFTVPCRTVAGIKEPTLSVGSQDTSLAGGHYERICVDDLEEDQNSRTPESIEQTKKFLASLRPLIEVRDGKAGWLDVVGTIYTFSGIGYSIRESELQKTKDKRQWRILSQPACEDYPNGKLLWPKRITLEYLKSIESNPAEGPAVLFPQYLLQPLVDTDGLIKTAEEIKYVPRRTFVEHIAPRGNWYVTVDLAGMDTGATGTDNDFTAINEHCWTGGRCYFSRIEHGRFSPVEVIDKLFDMYTSNPRIITIKVQKDAMSRVLAPFLNAAMSKRGVFLPIELVPIDNRRSKQQRIRGTKGFWGNGCFVFLDDLPDGVKQSLVKEAQYFPKYSHDDILDTITDALQNSDGEPVPEVQGNMPYFPNDLPPGLMKDGAEYTWKGIPIKALPRDLADTIFSTGDFDSSNRDEMTGA